MLFRQTSSKKQLVPKKKKIDEKVFRYWLVEFTLTSGEILQFYVNGLTQFDAYEKADGYKYWIANEKLKNKLSTFRLMP
jgi:cell division protein FtsI/penicillin-binding protein 2